MLNQYTYFADARKEVHVLWTSAFRTHTNTGTYGKHAGNGNQYFNSEFCINIHLSLVSTSKASA